MNCCRERVPADEVAQIEALLGMPILVGEWHFGALDVDLPASGIGHVRDQAAREEAYRVYVETAAALPGCMGVHYFTLYDELALGRFDGENWNIGFVDVCNQPYEPLASAARVSPTSVCIPSLLVRWTRMKRCPSTYPSSFCETARNRVSKAETRVLIRLVTFRQFSQAELGNGEMAHACFVLE